jgi:hypothetical protein
MSISSLLEVRVVDGSVEKFLESLGEVFVVHRGHDSGNTSYGVRIGAHAWFVKHAGPFRQAKRPATSHIVLQRAEVAVIAQPPPTSTERLAWLGHQLTFFWAMASIAVKYVGRAQSRRAVGQLGLLTEALLSLWRLLADANEPDPGLVLTNRARARTRPALADSRRAN